MDPLSPAKNSDKSSSLIGILSFAPVHTAATPAGAFGIYAIVAGIAWLFTWRYLPGAFVLAKASRRLILSSPETDKHCFDCAPPTPSRARPPAETKGLTLEEVRTIFEREVGMDGGRDAADSSRAPPRSARAGERNDAADLETGRDGYHVIGDEEEDEDESDLEQDSREAAADADADPSEAEGLREPDREHSSEGENRPEPSAVVSRTRTGGLIV